MTTHRRASLDELRAFHAKMMATASNSSDERLERIFELVPREAFLGPGPWQIKINRQYLKTPSADARRSYEALKLRLEQANTQGMSEYLVGKEPFIRAIVEKL